MRFTVAFFGMALAFSAVADSTFYSEKDSFKLISETAGLTQDGSFEFVGTSVKDGSACKIRVTRKAGTLEVRPLVPTLGVGDYRPALAMLPAFLSTEVKPLVYGSYDKGVLRGHYFIDNPGEFVIHGQFGVSFRLELENDNGKLVRIAVGKTQQMDLGFKPLGAVDCRR